MIHLIVNPSAAGGGTRGKVDAVTAAAREVFGDVQLSVTERQGHATDLARAAAREGASLVVAVGGDGTANEVVNGLFDGDTLISPTTAFGLLPAGTGGDLARTLRQPSDPLAALLRLRDLPRVACDALHVTFQTHDGGTGTRIGFNVVGFGLNGEVVARANRMSKRFGGRITFLSATIQAFVRWKAPRVKVRWTDDLGQEGSRELALSAAFVANAQFCGGGMWVGRGGSLHDGAADLTLMPELPLGRAILGGPRLFSGTLEVVKEVSRNRIVELEAISLSAMPVLLDIDGEQPGLLPISVRVLQKVLLVPMESPTHVESVG